MTMAPEPYKPQEYTPQTFKNTGYASSYRPDYEHKPFKAEYKPYKPTHTGIWGEKPREKKVRIQPEPTPKAEPKVYRSQKNLRLFDSYNHPKGPDIKVPEYKQSQHNLTPYQPTAYNPPNYISSTGPRGITPVDPLRKKTGFNADGTGINRRNPAEYKLTKANNPGLRHWRGNYVDDTVMARSTRESKPYPGVLGGTLSGSEKYKVQDKPARKPEPQPKPKPEPKPKPVPKETRKRSPVPPPPILISKTHKRTRSRTPEKTQTPEHSKTPENPPSPGRDDRYPYLVPVPVSPPVQKNAHSTQPYGNQPDTRTRQTTPVQEPVHRSSPETRQKESPRDRNERRGTPPPKVVPIVFAAANRRQKQTPTPPVKESQKPPTPKHESPRPTSEKVPKVAVVPVAHARPTKKSEKKVKNPTPVQEEQRNPTPVNQSPRNPTPIHETPRAPSDNRGIAPAVVVLPVAHARSSPKQKSKKRTPSPVKQRSPTPVNPTPKHESPRPPSDHRETVPMVVVIPVVHARASPKQKRSPTRAQESPRRSPTPRHRSPSPQAPSVAVIPVVHARASPKQTRSPVRAQTRSPVRAQASPRRSPTPRHRSPSPLAPSVAVIPVVQAPLTPKKDKQDRNKTPVQETPRIHTPINQTPIHQSPELEREDSWSRPAVPILIHHESVSKAPTRKPDSPKRNMTPVNQSPLEAPSPIQPSPELQREDSWDIPIPVVVQTNDVHKAPSPKTESPKKNASPVRESPDREPTPAHVSPQQRNPSPQKAKPEPTQPVMQEEPAQRETTPSHVTPIVAKPDSPKNKKPVIASQNSPRRAPTPARESPVQNAAPHSEERPKFFSYEQPQRNSPSSQMRSRFPPELTACIEAYNNAHAGGSLPSMRRSMGLGGN